MQRTTREKLTEALLAAAERHQWITRLPGCRLLRIHRDFQREEADRSRERSRPPDGVQATLLFVRLFEVYEIEAFEGMAKAILRRFPDSASRLHQSSLRELLERPGNFTGHSWTRIGRFGRLI